MGLVSSERTLHGLVLRLYFSSPSSTAKTPLLWVMILCNYTLSMIEILHASVFFIAADSTGQLALNALLERCEEVLLKFVADERLSGSCPLPR